MTERTKEASRHDARCPFCHADVRRDGERGDAVVACAACSTPHHAECFVENAGCSVMGCGGKEARSGDRAEPVPVGVIRARLASNGTPGGARPGFWKYAIFPAVAVTVSVVALGLKLGGWSVLASCVVGGAVAVLTILSEIFFVSMFAFFARPKDEPAIRIEGEPIPPEQGEAWQRAYFGQGNPYEPMRQRIAAERAASPEPAPSAAASASGERPKTCSACGNALDLDAESPAFCYHCGVSLA